MTINTSIWRPTWWNQSTHGVAWELAKDSLRRDWEQTKHDLHLGGTDLNQNVVDTLRQGTGNEPTHEAKEYPTVKFPVEEWKRVEMPHGYGYGARLEFGHLYPLWDPYLEAKLRDEWLLAKRTSDEAWTKVVDHVRRGYTFHAAAPLVTQPVVLGEELSTFPPTNKL